MKYIVKTLGLITAVATVSGALAATSRVSMVTRASPRLPSIAGFVSSGSTLKSATTTSYMADVDCIDSYTDCIKANDACGSDFEECTTNVLFHAQMPKCISVLTQCTASGRTALFGTSDTGVIATSSTTNSEGEVTDYTYPTASSVLGQMITAGKISNQLSTDQCVKKYTSCLKKDNVCGGDFELCTDKPEFKKQAVACESTLARCQSAGKIELFGGTTEATNLAPKSGSRLDDMITEGRNLAVNNAVATCNKVADQCILNACNKNPNKCIADRAEILIRISDAAKGGRAVTAQDLMEISKITTKRDVSDYIKQECKQTIGSNRYCYMTVKGNPVTKESVLTDPDNVDEVFDDMYNGEFGRFEALKYKINQIVDNFDSEIQGRCADTISSCAMRSCGGGIGSVCYQQSRTKNGDKIDKTNPSVNIAKNKTDKSYKEILSACRPIVDTDADCQYAAVLKNNNLYGAYMSDEGSVFTTLFDPTNDPIGVIASLNATLASSYNDAAIARMKKQCANVAVSCVKSMCGTDYTNCYRNRTDIRLTGTGAYNSGSSRFDKSMNKVGGVLDYNIVMGLCMNTVQNSSVCEEHLKVAAAEWLEKEDKNSWGYKAGDETKTYGSVRSAWLDTNSAITATSDAKKLVGCTGSEEQERSKQRCDTYTVAECDSTDEDGCVYDVPKYVEVGELAIESAGTSLFQEVLADVEREVQAQYNAKLTHEQNVCLANNTGGVRGADENGSTFMWVKLKGNKIPRNYVSQGLSAKDFTASNDLYGSFCRVRVTVGSSDTAVNDVLIARNKATAYFAVGDAFTCGSWLDTKTLELITKVVGEKAVQQSDVAQGSAKSNAIMGWAPVVGLLGGGIGGYFGMDALQKKGSSLGGLIGTSTADSDTCTENVAKAKSEQSAASSAISNAAESTRRYNNAVNYAHAAQSAIIKSGKDDGTDGAIKQAKNLTFSSKTYIAPTSGTSDTYKWTGDTNGAIQAARSAAFAAASAAVAQNASDAVKTACTTASNNFNALARRLAVAPTSTNDPATWLLDYDSYKNNCLSAKISDYNGSFSVESNNDGTKPGVGSSVSEDEVNKLGTDLNTLDKACQAMAGTTKKDRMTANLVAGAAMGAVGTALGVGIAKTVLDVKRQGIADEAVKQWMEEIGDKIQCYAGTEELGSYGDPVLLEID